MIHEQMEGRLVEMVGRRHCRLKPQKLQTPGEGNLRSTPPHIPAKCPPSGKG